MIRGRSLCLGAVSILVFLELAPGLIDAQRKTGRLPVSILVFLELAPGPSRSRPDDLTKLSFNPCFSGTRARTAPGPGGREEYSQVSILVFLELAPGLMHVDRIEREVDRFNPCFSGTRARTIWNTSSNRWTFGFNPCFSGTRARTATRSISP